MALLYQAFDSIGQTSSALPERYCRSIPELIHTVTRRENKGAYTPDELDLLLRYITPEKIAERSTDAYCVICEDGEKLVGCGILQHYREWEMNSLYILTPKQGIGTKILQMMGEKAREHGATTIEGYAINLPDTISFYLKRGCERKEDRTIEVGNIKLTLVRMVRDLTKDNL